MRRGMPDDHRVEVPERGTVSLGWLRERVFRISRGQTLAYVTDAADHAENRAGSPGLPPEPTTCSSRRPSFTAIARSPMPRGT